MGSKDFTTKQASTLHTGPHTNQTYLKLPVANLGELGYMHQALLNGVVFLSQPEEGQNHEKELKNSIYWLCKIILASYPQEKLESMDQWLENH